MRKLLGIAVPIFILFTISFLVFNRSKNLSPTVSDVYQVAVVKNSQTDLDFDSKAAFSNKKINSESTIEEEVYCPFDDAAYTALLFKDDDEKNNFDSYLLDLLEGYPDCRESLTAFLAKFFPKSYSVEKLLVFFEQMKAKEAYFDAWSDDPVGYDHISTLYFKAVRSLHRETPERIDLAEQMLFDAPDSPLTHDIVLSICDVRPKEKICQNLEGMAQYVSDALMKVRLAALPGTKKAQKEALFRQALMSDHTSFNGQLFAAYDKALFAEHQRSAVGLVHVTGILATRALPGSTGIQKFCKTSHALCYQVGQKIISRHDMESDIYGAILSIEAVGKLDEKSQLEYKTQRKSFYDQELEKSSKAFEKFMHLALSMQDPEISDGDFVSFVDDMNSVGYSEAYLNLMDGLYQKHTNDLISEEVFDQVSSAFEKLN